MLCVSLLTMALLGTSPAAATGLDPPEKWNFVRFKKFFNKEYSSMKEEQEHQLIFEVNQAKMIEHNRKGLSWTEGINQFSDLNNQQMQAYLGRRSTGQLELGTLMQQSKGHALPPGMTALPTSVDWRDANVITPVKNQGSCGSCWAFASTEQVESFVAINGYPLTELSPQELVSCDSNPDQCGGTGGCFGSIPELAYQYVVANGLASAAEYPYTSGTTGQTGTCNSTAQKSPVATVSGYVKLIQNNYTDVLTALATVGPLAVNVWANFQSYSGGVFSGCSLSQNQDINHVMQLVGYGTDNGEDYWIVRNSWGPAWGESGYIRLLRKGPGSMTTCGFDTTGSDGTGCLGDPAVTATCDTCGLIWDASYPTGAKGL